GTKVSWAYDWGSSDSGLNSEDFEFAPLLWGTDSDFTSSWSANAKDAISKGSEHLLCFNEPDLSTQSNLSPDDAAEGFKTYMMPFANSGVQLGSPAVTNGGAPMGLTWMGNFLDSCGDDCQVDFICLHWYDSYSNVAYFKSYLEGAWNQFKKPLWITEFGTTDGTDDQIASFLEEVLPWMDSQDYIQKYAFFMASDGKLVSGTELSDYGSVYATS
ncbi:hypothetical protein NA57DRAFT_35512, partial [Rhizodiscina lignyota]